MFVTLLTFHELISSLFVTRDKSSGATGTGVSHAGARRPTRGRGGWASVNTAHTGSHREGLHDRSDYGKG